MSWSSSLQHTRFERINDGIAFGSISAAVSRADFEKITGVRDQIANDQRQRVRVDALHRPRRRRLTAASAAAASASADKGAGAF